MCLSTCKLAFKTRVRVFRTILSHGRPETLVFQEFVHFLASNVVILHVDFFHDKELEALWGKVKPKFVVPRQQLPICKRVTFCKC